MVKLLEKFGDLFRAAGLLVAGVCYLIGLDSIGSMGLIAAGAVSIFDIVRNSPERVAAAIDEVKSLVK